MGSAGKRKGRAAIRELTRVLRRGSGRYVYVSHVEPRRRLLDLKFPLPTLGPPRDGESPTFDCETLEMPTPSKRIIGHGYICQRPSWPSETASSAENTEL